METHYEEELEPITKAELSQKQEKAHTRNIVGLFSFLFGGNIGIVTVAHDCAKMFELQEETIATQETMGLMDTLAKWRPAVQACDGSADGQYFTVATLDGCIHEIHMINDIEHGGLYFDILETVHCAIAPSKLMFATVSFTGFISEIEVGQTTFKRREPFANAKNVSCLKYSPDQKYLAIGMNDGVIELFDAEELKPYHKYEVHSMKIKRIEFLPGGEHFLSACDDKLIKMHSLMNLKEIEGHRSVKAVRVFSAHNAPVTALAVDEKSGGTRFASGSASGQIFIWHIEMTTPIDAVMNDHVGPISCLSFSPHGRHLFSGGDDMMLCVFKVPPTGEATPRNDQAYYDQQQQQYVVEGESYSNSGDPRMDQENHYQYQEQEESYQEYQPERSIDENEYNPEVVGQPQQQYDDEEEYNPIVD